MREDGENWNDIMFAVRKIIEIDEALCDGCGKCVPSCAEGAIRIENGKARLVSERYCDGLGACLGECPAGALRIVERAAEPFDETLAPQPAHACPSSQLRTFQPESAVPSTAAEQRSSLANWPIQIRLVPPDAPWLDGAHLLVAADCVPAACAGFHDLLLNGKAILMGCPKFDPAAEYAHKFGEIFARSHVERVTVAVMQVPCCQGLPRIIQAGMAIAGKTLPMTVVVVGFDGSLREALETSVCS